MPKEAFGGGDEGGGPPEEKKRLGLDRFGLSPDTNIRDVFWKIMGSYAATKKPGVELSTLEHDRFALMRVALSILSRDGKEHFGLSPRFITVYTIMMLLDGGWKDALEEFLSEGADEGGETIKIIAAALVKLFDNEQYKQSMGALFTEMLRGRGMAAVGLAYLPLMKNPELVRSCRTELMILAKGDIGQNQLNAIRAITLIREEEDIKRTLILLLSHWDVDARAASAEALQGMTGDAVVREAASRRLASESDEEIKKILQRLAK